MPKEMLPIIDKPVIHYVVQEAIQSGIEDIIIITGRGKRSIEDYFDASPELELHLQRFGKQSPLGELEEISSFEGIHYIRQKDPLGLGQQDRPSGRGARSAPDLRLWCRALQLALRALSGQHRGAHRARLRL